MELISSSVISSQWVYCKKIINLTLHYFCAVDIVGEEKLDVLVANAGFGSLGFSLTEDGVESHLGVNHLGESSHCAVNC